MIYVHLHKNYTKVIYTSLPKITKDTLMSYDPPGIYIIIILICHQSTTALTGRTYDTSYGSCTPRYRRKTTGTPWIPVQRGDRVRKDDRPREARACAVNQHLAAPPASAPCNAPRASTMYRSGPSTSRSTPGPLRRRRAMSSLPAPLFCL